MSLNSLSNNFNFQRVDMQNRSRSLPRNQTMDKMAGELDSDRSYDPLERQIFQMAKQASKEADRLRDSASNMSGGAHRTLDRQGRGRTLTGGNGGTLGRSTRPRSVGAFNRRGGGHLSGSEGTRFSSGPDADSEYNRSDTEKIHRSRPNQIEYVSGPDFLIKRFSCVFF